MKQSDTSFDTQKRVFAGILYGAVMLFVIIDTAHTYPNFALLTFTVFLISGILWLYKLNNREVEESPEQIAKRRADAEQRFLDKVRYSKPGVYHRPEESEEMRSAREATRAEQYKKYVTDIQSGEYLKKIDPREFEKVAHRLFARMGYRVEATPYSGDNGSDGFLYKDGKKTVLQCKRVKGAVGEPILRDLFGTMHASQSQGCIILTTGNISKQARHWSKDKPMRIIELQELVVLIRTHFTEGEVVPVDFSSTGFKALPVPVKPKPKQYSPIDKSCPRCGKQLRIVIGRRGNFVGCSGYPECRHTEVEP